MLFSLFCLTSLKSLLKVVQVAQLTRCFQRDTVFLLGNTKNYFIFPLLAVTLYSSSIISANSYVWVSHCIQTCCTYFSLEHRVDIFTLKPRIDCIFEAQSSDCDDPLLFSKSLWHSLTSIRYFSSNTHDFLNHGAIRVKYLAQRYKLLADCWLKRRTLVYRVQCFNRRPHTPPLIELMDAICLFL